MFVTQLYVFFGEMSKSFFPLFDWVVCFSGVELYELLVYFGNNPLSVVAFGIIFSHSEGCLFTLLLVSLAVQMLLSLIRSHLFIFVFISITLGGVIEDPTLSYVIECSALFSSKSFIVSGLIFRSLIHFELSLCFVLGSVLISFFCM